MTTCLAGRATPYTLLDRRLYLPAPWFAEDHRELWRACAIPAAIPFQTKAELAAEMVTRVRQEPHLQARWLTCDEWYGRNPTFLDQVAATGLSYLAEVPHDTQVWPLREPASQAARAHPQRWVPPRPASGKGRRPTRERFHPDSPPPVRVDQLARQLSADAWHRYRILEGSKGPLVADFAAMRAVATRDGLPGPEVWVLFRRAVRDPADTADPPELKVYLSNAPADTPLAELVRVSGMRWPIESCFPESKGELGLDLDHYELRFWRGWHHQHHHMTLVILAHHFLVRLQQRLSPREGGRPAASRALRRRVARRLPRAGGLPRRRRGVVPPDTDAARPPEPRRGALAAARRPPFAPGRCARGLSSAQLPAPAQGSCLSFPSPPDSAAAR